jgi:superfamily II DNA or RNA helicase
MDLSTILTSMDVQPRPYQQRIVGKAVDLFTNRQLRSVLIDSPTGSGKTIMGLLIARVLQDRLGLRVGWVAMRRYLLAQARARRTRSAASGSALSFSRCSTVIHRRSWISLSSMRRSMTPPRAWRFCTSAFVRASFLA